MTHRKQKPLTLDMASGASPKTDLDNRGHKLSIDGGFPACQRNLITPMRGNSLWLNGKRQDVGKKNAPRVRGSNRSIERHCSTDIRYEAQYARVTPRAQANSAFTPRHRKVIGMSLLSIRNPTKFIVSTAPLVNLCQSKACYIGTSHDMPSDVDPIGMGRYRHGVAVNPATGFSSPKQSLRISAHAVFAALVRLQWAALVGRPSGLPVRDCRSANPALRRPSRLAAGSGNLNANPEGTMYTIMPRALSRLFPTRRIAFILYRRRAISGLTLVRLIGGAA
ncbi:hypothetical protein QU481_14025 [Crenobacter sp. SG2303]|uniref:Uncharacterized protein n=1 Tax=Crenobacter oryzisoli TaxID=3056844 RepID=A0ABT7XQE9_9NEIS|nr:hypothetical protein [Crenobacter sp. SG2303]MDN0076005.1 hypothetical protein [Crenobacter sp. SG2303]